MSIDDTTPPLAEAVRTSHDLDQAEADPSECLEDFEAVPPVQEEVPLPGADQHSSTEAPAVQPTPPGRNRSAPFRS